MPTIRKVVKIFLGSPGDVMLERGIVKAAIDDINSLLAEQTGYQVELIGWENVSSSHGRPQEIINRELDQCDYFLGLMWKRWGTPPDLNGTYSSGFQEEYETSIKRREAHSRPEISLLFKSVDPELLRDPGDELKKVIAFRQKLIEGKQILFEDFSDSADLEKRVRRCIHKYVFSLVNAETENIENSQANEAPASEVQESTTRNIGTIPSPLSTEGIQFLREFISKTSGTSPVPESIKAAEIARFRLLSGLVGSQANDDRSLGIHDTNLIYSQGRTWNFGLSEMFGLLSSGFEHYANQNAPLWHWVKGTDGLKRHVLQRFTTFGTPEKRSGALLAMTRIHERLSDDLGLNRDYFLDSWFSKSNANMVKVAALDYLAECGISSDLNAIRAVVGERDNQTIGAATNAIIRISLRNSRDDAIVALYELQPSYISADLLTELFANAAALSKQVLLDGVTHQSLSVRRKVVELLLARRMMSNQISEQLLADTDPLVRYYGLKFLLDSGRIFSEQEAQAIICPIKSGNSLNSFPTWNSLLGADRTADDCWKQYRRDIFSAKNTHDLTELANHETVLDQTPYFVLAERNFKHYAGALRNAIDDDYNGEFEMGVEKIRNRFTVDPNIPDRILSLEAILRQGLSREALNIICRKRNAEDIGRVRAALKRGFVIPNLWDIEYLGKFGEWQDIALIVECISRPQFDRDTYLPSVPAISMYQMAAQAAYSIGHTRVSEILKMELPTRMKSSLIVELPDTAFRELKDDSIDQLLRSDDDKIRFVTALKCVKVKTKAQLDKLVTNYIGAGAYFYNVIHWLDFGVSVPKIRAIASVQRVLNNE